LLAAKYDELAKVFNGAFCAAVAGENAEAYDAMVAYSTPSWARIPREGGHDFHAMVGTDSTGRWAPCLMG
jgi:hypothetical protein